jgi:glycosyltransferase involved in cell wall biosynthesis
MRIIFFTAETYPNYRADLHCLFGKYLVNFQIHTDIVTQPNPNVVNAAHIDWPGGATLLSSIPTRGSLKDIIRFAHCFRTCLSVKHGVYDAIQVRDMPIIAVFLLPIAIIKKVKFIYWMSYPIPTGQLDRARRTSLKNPLKKLFLYGRSFLSHIALYRLVLPFSNFIFLQTDEMLNMVRRKGVYNKNIMPVPMAVDYDLVHENLITPIHYPGTSGKNAIIYLGTIERPRRIELLLEMMRVILNARQDIVLLVLGESDVIDYQDELNQLTDKLDINEHVIWLGKKPMHKAWQYVKSAKVGLSPIPRGELLDVGSPTKVVEYLALGIPVVGNDNPDQKKVIEESGGGVCVPLTAQDFAEAVLYLLQEDATSRDNRILKGMDYVQRHRNYKATAQAVAECYNHLLRH